jgi:hypothetical protein
LFQNITPYRCHIEGCEFGTHSKPEFSLHMKKVPALSQKCLISIGDRGLTLILLFSKNVLGQCLYFSFSIHKPCILSQKSTTALLCFPKNLISGGIQTHANFSFLIPPDPESIWRNFIEHLGRKVSKIGLEQPFLLFRGRAKKILLLERLRF